MSRPPDGARPVAVVGAGIAGLACARVLHDAGFAVTVFDKGRSPCGRACSRREDGPGAGDTQFDHGAQYFTVKDGRFRPYADAWLEGRRREGMGPSASPRFEDGNIEKKTGSGRRFIVGVSAMSALPKHLVRGPRHSLRPAGDGD